MVRKVFQDIRKYGVLMCGLILICFLSYLVLISGKNGKFVVAATVTNVGTCGGGEGFFSGNYECAVEATSGSGVMYTNVNGQVVIGQTVYKHCWVEDSGNRCFTTAEKHIHKGWLE